MVDFNFNIKVKLQVMLTMYEIVSRESSVIDPINDVEFSASWHRPFLPEQVVRSPAGF